MQRKLSTCQRHCLERAMASKHPYTEEELRFLASTIPGRTWREVSEAFEKRFGTTLTKNQIIWAKQKLGVASGIRAGMFEKGNVPKQGSRFNVGDERRDKDGYVFVKVCESKHDNPQATRKAMKCWRLKSHIVWEEANGKPVPDDCQIVFANRDIEDFTPENLVAVPKSLFPIIRRNRIQYHDAETLKSAMLIAEIKRAKKRKKKQAKEIANGKVH